MAFWKIFINKLFWIHLGIILLSVIFLLIVTFISMKIYTQHGKSFALPDFTGLTEAQFQNLIKKNNLRYSIIDSIYSDNFPKGTVVEQVPKANEHVKKNRKIFFTINSWTDEQVSVPNLIDYSMRNARVMLESFGLKLGELVYIPSEFANLVLGQMHNGKPIEPGTTVPKGTSIDLLIGKGFGGEMTSVPNLKGLDKKVSEQILQRVYLYVGAVIYDETVVTTNDSATAFVWRQNPVAKEGAAINVGASINIWLTKNEAKLKTVEPLYEEDDDESSESDTSFEDEFI